MAVLAPVLERKLNTEQKTATEERNAALLTDDERHNSRIRANYEKLINPDATANDVLSKEPVVQRKAEIAVTPVREQQPFLVRNARVDSDIFRADSAINRKSETASVSAEEEESEDVRPTPTTIQYKSGNVSKAENISKIVIDDKISNKKSRLSKLSKRDMIIIAVTLLVVVALFVLVIVNSAVLSNLNSEIDYLQSDLVVAQDNYIEALQAKEAYLQEENISQVVNKFATSMGMVEIGK